MKLDGGDPATWTAQLLLLEDGIFAPLPQVWLVYGYQDIWETGRSASYHMLITRQCQLPKNGITLQQTNMAGWKIPIFNREYIFKKGSFSIARGYGFDSGSVDTSRVPPVQVQPRKLLVRLAALGERLRVVSRADDIFFGNTGEQWKKQPGYLGYTGDEILPTYVGIIVDHYKDP